jgi:hypothetical protein
MPGLDLAAGHIESSKQGGGAMKLIAVVKFGLYPRF